MHISFILTMKRLVIAAALVALPALAAVFSAAESNAADDFQLWNACKPTHLVVEGLNNDAAEIGLTKERIATLARSRLRAARIYSNILSEPYLYVRVSVVSVAFNTEVQFNKYLFDPISEISGYAPTWDSGQTGTHGQNASFILQVLSEEVDKFIDEYLRVNAEAC